MNIRIDYDQLAVIASDFSQQADLSDDLYRALAAQVDNLRTGGWLGEGAHAFYIEMDELILPACAALVLALNETHTVLNQVIRVFEEAEAEAASPFLITQSQADTLRNNLSLLFSGIDIAAFINNYEDIIKNGFKLGSLDVAMTLFSGFLGGAIDLSSGEETDIFNAFGKNLYSAGIDLGVTALARGVPVVAIATLVTEGVSFAGQMGVGFNRELNDFMELDPRVQLELERGLDYDERVFQGFGELVETWDGLKNIAWDVMGRPVANDIRDSINHFNNGIQTGDPGEFLRSAGHLMEATVLTSSGLGFVNAATDADAFQHFSQHSRETLNHGWNFAVSASQIEGAVTRLPMRLGVTTFNGMVNALPLDPQLQQNLNAASLEAAETINNLPGHQRPYMNIVDFSVWDAPQRAFEYLGM